jgi:hypothetical protein
MLAIRRYGCSSNMNHTGQVSSLDCNLYLYLYLANAMPCLFMQVVHSAHSPTVTYPSESHP